MYAFTNIHMQIVQQIKNYKTNQTQKSSDLCETLENTCLKNSLRSHKSSNARR